MIFVTVGNGYWPFDRLIRELDAIAPHLPVPIFAQIGPTGYRPVHFEWRSFLPFREMEAQYRDCLLAIGHASAGPILQARKFGKPVVLVPRDPDHGELVDRHQIQTGRAVEGVAGIRVLWDIRELEAVITVLVNEPQTAWEGRAAGAGLPALVTGLRAFVQRTAEEREARCGAK